jgi:photosystem II stability/assembly factor-like uncharacterized protein
MTLFKRILSAGSALMLAASATALLASCVATTGDASGDATGVVGIRVNLDRPGTALGKAAGDTTFSLDSLKIRLTSSGGDTLNYVYAISGDVGSSSVPVTIKYFTLKALKTWKAKIVSIDTTVGSPNTTDTIHVDSVTFNVLPSDTTLINPTIVAAYLMLKQRLIANNPDSMPSGIRYIRMMVAGVVRDSFALGSGINSVSFVTSKAGWGVGDFGAIVKTTDGGATWVKQSSGTSQNLNRVFMSSSTVGYAVGDSGTILKTSDGNTWAAQTSGVTNNLYGVHAFSATNVWVVGAGGRILHTNVGGTTWLNKASGTNVSLNAVFATAATHAWVAGNSGTLLKTTDSVNFVSRTSGTVNHLYAVRFAPSSATEGWIAGASGTLRKTTDSATWNPSSLVTTSDLRSVSILAAGGIAYVAGANGVIYKTTNASTWSSQTTNTTRNITSVAVTQTDSAFAAGADAPYLTIANAGGGSTWTQNNLGSRGFNKVLAYKRFPPGVNRTVVIQAIDTTAGALRGYEASVDIQVTAGQDTTLTVNLLDKCGYGGSTLACTVP